LTECKPRADEQSGGNRSADDPALPINVGGEESFHNGLAELKNLFAMSRAVDFDCGITGPP
jgi:hypothetical protein